MSKHQGRMQVVALQTSLATALSDNKQLSEALAELGYCHAQQTAFITDSASGPDGLISKDILFNENKIALAEAVATNKRLTDDLEFQALRYKLQAGRTRQLGQACATAEGTIDKQRGSIYWHRVAVIALGSICALGTAYHLPGLF